MHTHKHTHKHTPLCLRVSVETRAYEMHAALISQNKEQRKLLGKELTLQTNKVLTPTSSDLIDD